MLIKRIKSGYDDNKLRAIDLSGFKNLTGLTHMLRMQRPALGIEALTPQRGRSEEYERIARPEGECPN
ncbi:hypothetical protein [Marinifilum sp.]|uniref:hypothetical protein n=1 Tax=Marinifilum sp. TaxID=2033137 RepID=UPI003BAADB64